MSNYALPAAMAVLLSAAPALAQPAAASGNTNLLRSGAPSSAHVPASTAKPVGAAVVKGGEVVVIGSGAHNTGPAPVVTGAVPQTEGFADGVTDGTEKLGHGAKATGKAIQREGVTVDAKGAQSGLSTAPGRTAAQARRGAATVVPK